SASDWPDPGPAAGVRNTPTRSPADFSDRGATWQSACCRPQDQASSRLLSVLRRDWKDLVARIDDRRLRILGRQRQELTASSERNQHVDDLGISPAPICFTT